MRRLPLLLLILLSLPAPAKEGRLSWALKTNLLSDAALIPDIGVEAFLDGRWSLDGDWHYAWWKNDRKRSYRQTYGGSLCLKKWLGTPRNGTSPSGHHLGIFGRILSYDFENGGQGQMGALPGGALWDRCGWGLGLEYGWSFQMTRKLNVDFSLGAGYIGGTYATYEPVDDHYVWQETSRRRWFGPAKVEISLVWLIGEDNFNSKGGRR